MELTMAYSGNIRGAKNHLLHNGKSMCGTQLQEPIVLEKTFTKVEQIRFASPIDCQVCFGRVGRKI